MGQAQSFTEQFVYHTAVGDGGEACSPIYRAASHPTELVQTYLDNSVTTSWDLFDTTVRKLPNRKFLGRRFREESTGRLGDYEWMTYAEAKKIAMAFGTVISGLMAEDLPPPPEGVTNRQYIRPDRILGVYAKNCVEWFLAEQACNAYGLTLCPLYDTLGDEAMEFIFKQTEMRTALVAFENLEALVRVLDASPKAAAAEANAVNMKDHIYLRHIILVNPSMPSNPSHDIELYRSSIEKAKALGLQIDLWHEIVSRCTKPLPVTPGNFDDLNTLCYTSGTTGMPKAVLLTHRIVVSVVVAAARGPISPYGFFEVSANDYTLSYLPLAHVFERCVCNVVINKGGAIGVYSGDMAKLLDDVKVIRPTVFTSVPRLFNRINDRVCMNLLDKNAPVQALFSVGLNSKINKRKNESATQHRVWDSIVFNKIRGMMGGRLRGMISGGAPLDPVVAQKMEAFFACPLMQGYGLSETFGPCFLMHPQDPTAGYIGGVWPAVEFKLQSVPELNYFVSDPKNGKNSRWIVSGELLLRGPGVTPGYYKNEEETRQAFDDEGWFHTGDIASLHPRTLAVKIIDRKKNIFKLAQGEYVAPEKVESVYSQALSVGQIFVYGESVQPFLVAIVYPDVEGCKQFKQAGPGADIYTLCGNPAFHEFVKQDMEATAKKMALAGFEKVKDFVFTTEPFTVENNLLTPTSKLRRAECKKRYQKDINNMYKA